MNRTRSLGIVGIVLGGLLGVAVPPVGAFEPYLNNFESDSIGSVPVGWSSYNTSPTSSVLVAAPPNPISANGAKALQYYDNDSGQFPFAQHLFSSPIPTNEEVKLNFDFNYQPSDSSARTLVQFLNAANQGFRVSLFQNGIRIWDTSVGESSILSITTSQWYRALITLSPVASANHTASLLLTNLTTATYVGALNYSYQPITSGFDRLSFQENSAPSLVNNSVFFDNFAVIPEPSTLWLLGFGAAALGMRLRRK